MVIKVLGSGCTKCNKLEKNVEKFLEETGMEATIEKVVEFKEIVAYGVMKTPALVVDEKLVSAGKVLSVKELKKLLAV